MLNEVKIYSPAGVLMRHGFKNQKGKYCGIVKEYHADQKYKQSVGKIKSVLNYVNGKKLGLQKYYNRTGVNINNVRVYSEEYPNRTIELFKDRTIYRHYHNNYKSVDISVYKGGESLSSNDNGMVHYNSHQGYTCRYNFGNENRLFKHISINRFQKSIYYDNNKITMTVTDNKIKYDKIIIDHGLYGPDGQRIEILYQNITVDNKPINLLELFGYEALTLEDIAYLKLKFS